MNGEEAENIRKQASSRILLHHDGKSTVKRLQAERGRLREMILPLNEWFERFAHEYRQRSDDLSAVVKGGGNYWPAPLFGVCVQEIDLHFRKAEEYLCGVLFYLEQHEMRHPLVQSLLELVVARTLADLAGPGQILARHIAAAIQCRPRM